MKVLFFGTSEFAVPSLQALHQHPSFAVLEVVTQEDRPRDRGQKLKASPVKEWALKNGVPVYQPSKIRGEDIQKRLESVPADVIVVASYGQILPSWLLNLKPFGAINVHASLLPRHRGAAPIQYALLSGDKETGVTIMQMDVGLDTGPILLQKSIPIGDQETAGDLHRRLALLGGDLLIETLLRLLQGTVSPLPQTESLATKAPKIGKEEGKIDWNIPAALILNRIRAFHPWPICFCFFRQEEIKIWRAAVFPCQKDPLKPGTASVEMNKHLVISCGEGTSLEVLELSLSGRKHISGADFINGFRVRSGELFQ